MNNNRIPQSTAQQAAEHYKASAIGFIEKLKRHSRFFNWLFQQSSPPKREYDNEVIRNDMAVRCADCGQHGLVLVSLLHYPELPKGWIMTHEYLDPLFLCPSCQKKRREQWKDLLNI